MAEQEQQTPEKQIAIQKIYIKDFSFESPSAPDVFSKSDWSPKTNLNLRSSHSVGKENVHEVILSLTIEAKDEEKTVFLIELHQAGLFFISGYGEEEFKALVGSFCPNILFPYARETIASMVVKGGFPEFILQPINFDALYAHGLAQAEAEAGEEGEATIVTDATSGSNGGTH
ncbi:MAG: protein-export chaperone SecB [Gammaproteobacteria bacterium]|nr:MAG: protein-export chaperone SecB [Gammaproteobacteria bacterium]RLA33907.1 MAG: protein-export chaperone SecB [Gammaproteobacteria bacterium]